MKLLREDYMAKVDSMRKLLDILNQDDEDEVGALPPIDGQKELLAEFIKTPVLAVGDYVVRNAFGKHKYKYPTDRQIAVVSAVFDRPMLDENGNVAHGEISIVFERGAIITYSTDFRYCEKV